MDQRDLIATMLSQLDRLGERQTEMLVKQTEQAERQAHITEAVDEIRSDIAEIQQTQNTHTEDIRSIRSRLEETTALGKSLKEFVFGHPVIAVILTLMLTNIILGSLGLPLINIKDTWNVLVNGS